MKCFSFKWYPTELIIYVALEFYMIYVLFFFLVKFCGYKNKKKTRFQQNIDELFFEGFCDGLCRLNEKNCVWYRQRP